MNKQQPQAPVTAYHLELTTWINGGFQENVDTGEWSDRSAVSVQRWAQARAEALYPDGDINDDDVTLLTPAEAKEQGYAERFTAIVDVFIWC